MNAVNHKIIMNKNILELFKICKVIKIKLKTHLKLLKKLLKVNKNVKWDFLLFTC